MDSVIVEERELPGGYPRARLKQAILCALLVVFVVFLYHVPFSKSNYLLSDSADYVHAAHSPFLATYFNTDSASPVQLFAMRKSHAFAVHPWDYLYVHGDNAALRHFHSPLSFYPMHVVSMLTAADSHQRTISSLVTAMTCGVIVVGLALFGVPLVVASLVGMVAGIQSRYIEVSVDPSPHSWYMLFAVLFLFSFAGYLLTRRFRMLAVSAVLFAFAFATLEFSLELISSVALALGFLWIVDRRALGDLKALAVSLAKALPIFLGTTFILWPGGWIRGGYLESYGVTGATLLLKNKAAFGGHAGGPGLYSKLFGGHEGLVLLAAFAIYASVALIVRGKLTIPTIVLMSYTSVAVALGIADHFRLDTYVSEALLFCLVTVALLFRDCLTIRADRRRQYTAIAVVVLVMVGTQEWLRRPVANLYQPWLSPILAGVSSKVPGGATILVNDNWEAYNNYLPAYHYVPTVSNQDATPRSPERANEIRFALLTNEAPEPAGATLLDSFPTNTPGRTVELYAEGK